MIYGRRKRPTLADLEEQALLRVCATLACALTASGFVVWGIGALLMRL